MRAHFILYVHDQSSATRFYRAVLGADPTLEVPGMTEFRLGDDSVLGLMPEAGIQRLLGPTLPDPTAGDRPPRAELYLLVNDPSDHHNRALAAGATELSPCEPRDWGHDVAYVRDPDGHVVAFASER